MAGVDPSTDGLIEKLVSELVASGSATIGNANDIVGRWDELRSRLVARGLGLRGHNDAGFPHLHLTAQAPGVDATTRMPDWAAFDLFCEQTLSHPFGALAADVNGCGVVRHEHGNAAVGQIVAAVAERIRSTFVQDKAIFNDRGDEFVVIVPGVDVEAAEALAAELEHDLVSLEGLPAEVGASYRGTMVNGSSSEAAGETVSACAGRARAILYARKRAASTVRLEAAIAAGAIQAPII